MSHSNLCPGCGSPILLGPQNLSFPLKSKIGSRTMQAVRTFLVPVWKIGNPPLSSLSSCCWPFRSHNTTTLGRSPGEGNGNPLQYSCLENSMDRGARWAIVHGVTRSWTRLSNFHSFTCSPELFSELNSEGRVLGTTKKNAFLKM